jgi:hypothetical protein
MKRLNTENLTVMLCLDDKKVEENMNGKESENMNVEEMKVSIFKLLSRNEMERKDRDIFREWQNYPHVKK